mgnify:CR=1 FL=1
MVEDIFNFINEMIVLNTCKLYDELWVSTDIKAKLGSLKEYKGYKIYHSVLLPDDYMAIGKMYYTEQEINNIKL